MTGLHNEREPHKQVVCTEPMDVTLDLPNAMIGEANFRSNDVMSCPMKRDLSAELCDSKELVTTGLGQANIALEPMTVAVSDVSENPLPPLTPIDQESGDRVYSDKALCDKSHSSNVSALIDSTIKLENSINTSGPSDVLDQSSILITYPEANTMLAEDLKPTSVTNLPTGKFDVRNGKFPLLNEKPVNTSANTDSDVVVSPELSVPSVLDRGSESQSKESRSEKHNCLLHTSIEQDSPLAAGNVLCHSVTGEESSTKTVVNRLVVGNELRSVCKPERVNNLSACEKEEDKFAGVGKFFSMHSVVLIFSLLIQCRLGEVMVVISAFAAGVEGSENI